MKPLHLILTGVAVFVLALLLQAPAALIYAWSAGGGEAAAIRLHGIEGTLFSGRASQVVRNGQPLVSGLSWRLRPWALPLGRASYRLNALDAPLRLDGEVAVGLGGTRIDGLKLGGDLRSLAGAAGQVFVPVAGDVALDLERLHLRGDWPAAAEGRIELRGLSWALARDPVPLGDFEAQIRTDNGEIAAVVGTLRGALEVIGDARLKPDRSYELNLRLRPRPDAPAALPNLLRGLGTPDAQGYYPLRQNGSFAPAAPRVPAGDMVP